MKTRPILSTNLDDLLIKHEAFSKPHESVWQTLIKKTCDESLKKWIGKPDYFIGVNLAMDKLMPKATREEKTLQVRSWYQEAVVDYIETHPECVNWDVADRLRELKTKYRLILLTTNTQKYITKILKAAGLANLYDAVVASQTDAEPKKSEILDELISEYGKPRYYLSGKQELDIKEKLERLEIKIIGISDLDSI